jgi:[ribosomal protein S18]-alanine N-acetyltransferase
MEILPLKADHLETVTRIEREVFRDPWPESAFLEILSFSDKCWVAVQDGIIAGYLMTQWVLDEIHIFNIAVDRHAQRQGIARQLLEFLIAEGVHGGMCDLFLEVRVSNEAARTLYEKLGFHEVARRKKYYADGEDALVMSAEIGTREAVVPAGQERPDHAR